jgi:hypothetical protein
MISEMTQMNLCTQVLIRVLIIEIKMEIIIMEIKMEIIMRIMMIIQVKIEVKIEVKMEVIITGSIPYFLLSSIEMITSIRSFYAYFYFDSISSLIFNSLIKSR